MILIAALHAFLDAKLLLQVSFKWKKNPMENNFSAVRSESNRPTPGPRPGAELSIRCPHLLRGWRFTAHARVHIDARGFDPHQVKQAVVLRLEEMTSEHLRNVVLMLTDQAPVLHMAAITDLVVDDDPVALTLELALYELTGGCLATVSPSAWLQATPLVRAIDNELNQRTRT